PGASISVGAGARCGAFVAGGVPGRAASGVAVGAAVGARGSALGGAGEASVGGSGAWAEALAHQARTPNSPRELRTGRGRNERRSGVMRPLARDSRRGLEDAGAEGGKLMGRSSVT